MPSSTAHRPLTIVVAALLCACSPPEDPPGDALPGRSDVICSATLTDQHYLETADGRHLYVEPRLVDTSGGGMVVAGTPTYASFVEEGQGGDLRASPAPGAPFFGAYFDRSEARTIPRPPEAGPVRWAHGARLGADRWGFVMEAAEADSLDAAHRALIYAELEPDGWSGVEQLQAPQGGELLYGVASRPVEIRGEIVWSVIHSMDARMTVVVYRRGANGWRSPEVLDVSSNEVDALVRDDGSLRFVITGLDPAAEFDHASLRIVSRAGTEWPEIVWAAEPGEQLFGLVSTMSTSDPHAGWILRGGDRDGAWVAALASSAPRTSRLIDSRAGYIHPLGTREGWSYWLTSGPDSVTGTGRLRIYRVSATVTERVADLPDPFIGFSAGILSPSGEVVVVGPEAHFETTPPFVRSLVLRFSLICDS